MSTPVPPLSLYVHLPWCVRKCPYCDFNSHQAHQAIPERAYVDALLADLDTERTDTGGRELISVFLGGGTPSLFSAEALARLLEGIRARLPLARDAEITLEANPGTVERGRFTEYAAAGISRLSIGVQSFDETCLKALGRIHSASEARHAAEEAHAAALGNFNLDLMYGLPGQGAAGAARDVRAALALEPAHLSHYELTLEPGTVFAAHPPRLPDENVMADMQEDCQNVLAEAGFRQYEISAWALPGARCRHNLNYWTFGDYLGIGAGAHGKLTLGNGRVRRRWKLRSPRLFMEAAGTPRALAGEELVPAGQRAFEFMLNNLRLREGFTLDTLRGNANLTEAALEPGLGVALERGLLEQPEPGRYRATATGWRYLNDLQALFLPDDTRDGRGAA
ncbi:MAG: radical SAM family heme chaperone HemW [Gammaproteobacteria bacterium]|jgi:oxygen-independent coproporphyrinogen-3 oxidase